MLAALDDAGGVSCHHYVSTVQFRDARARNECLQIALFVDAYLGMQIDGVPLPEQSTLLDLMARRLIGVMKADEHSNWSLATATQRSGTTRMTGSALFMQLSRAANAYDRLQKAVSKTSAAPGVGQKTRRGHRGRGGRTQSASTGTAARSGDGGEAAAGGAARRR
jgi:hypothetical protein